jgi:hypothetical protein
MTGRSVTSGASRRNLTVRSFSTESPLFARWRLTSPLNLVEKQWSSNGPMTNLERTVYAALAKGVAALVAWFLNFSSPSRASAFRSSVSSPSPPA